VVANSLAVFIQKERSLEKVKESESFLYSVLEGIGQGVVVIDRDMKIVKVNQGFLRLMGMSIEEVLGNTCHEVSHGSSKPCHLNGEVCTVKTVFETGLPQSALHAHSAKDGTPLHVQTVAYPIHDASGRVVAAVETVTDLTDRVKLEKDLEKRVKELEEFYDMAVGRELRMIELKEEIAHLREELARHKK
jgi:PAS domain S-box-containing protein